MNNDPVGVPTSARGGEAQRARVVGAYAPAARGALRLAAGAVEAFAVAPVSTI